MSDEHTTDLDMEGDSYEEKYRNLQKALKEERASKREERTARETAEAQAASYAETLRTIGALRNDPKGMQKFLTDTWGPDTPEWVKQMVKAEGGRAATTEAATTVSPELGEIKETLSELKARFLREDQQREAAARAAKGKAAEEAFHADIRKLAKEAGIEDEDRIKAITRDAAGGLLYEHQTRDDAIKAAVEREAAVQSSVTKARDEAQREQISRHRSIPDTASPPSDGAGGDVGATDLFDTTHTVHELRDNWRDSPQRKAILDNAMKGRGLL